MHYRCKSLNEVTHSFFQINKAILVVDLVFIRCKLLNAVTYSCLQINSKAILVVEFGCFCENQINLKI